MPSTPRKTIARLSPASVASASGRPARRTRSGPPPGYDELEVRSHGKLGSDVEGVGNDREPAVVDELAGHLRGSRPPRQPQGHSLRYQCRGGPGDTALLLLVLGALVSEGQLVSDSLGHRAAVGAREQALLLQDLQVPPNRGRGARHRRSSPRAERGRRRRRAAISPNGLARAGHGPLRPERDAEARGAPGSGRRPVQDARLRCRHRSPSLASVTRNRR
jgi:hypothetical protein